jgi:sarcosine oxidase, subunit gamma
MSEPRFDSPLAGHAAPHNLTISITEIVDRGMIDLRGDPENRSFAAAVDAVLGSSLPRLQRTSVVTNELSVLWLSVDQWLVQCPRAQASGLARRLQEVLAGIPSLVVDMSDARTIIRLQGEGVREVIMKGAPVDLTAPGFIKGSVRRMRFGELAAMVHMVDEAPDVIDLYVFRSYAVFAWEWLVATGHGAAQVRLFKPQAAPTA